MIRIGLTGGMGSGKTTVAQMLAQHGCAVMDADAMARELTSPGAGAMAAIAQAFGASVLDADGGLNRAAMRERMLSEEGAKKRLEAILHPLISKAMDERVQKVPADSRAVVLDIPLLVEGGDRWRGRVDTVWVVDCERATQIRRVQARSQWPVAQIEAMLGQQASREQRLRCADVVICNEGLSLLELAQQVRTALTQVLEQWGADS